MRSGSTLWRAPRSRATPLMVMSRRASWIRQGLVTGSGLLSFGFGLFLAYQIGIVDHLFSTAPIWIPQ